MQTYKSWSKHSLVSLKLLPGFSGRKMNCQDFHTTIRTNFQVVFQTSGVVMNRRNIRLHNRSVSNHQMGHQLKCLHIYLYFDLERIIHMWSWSIYRGKIKNSKDGHTERD